MEKNVFQIDELVEFREDKPFRKVLVQESAVRCALFCLKAGQGLDTHVAPGRAIVQFLSGQATFTLGTEEHTAGRGAFFHLPPGTPHAVHARKDAVFLVFMSLGEAGVPAPTA